MCRSARRDEGRPDARAAFAIRRAYRDRVVIGQGLLQRIEHAAHLRRPEPCLGDRPLNYVVRTRDSFIVVAATWQPAQASKPTPPAAACSTPAPIRSIAAARVSVARFRNHAFTIRSHKPGPDDPVLEPAARPVARDPDVDAGRQADLVNLANLGFGGAASVVPVQMHYNAVDR